MVASDEGRICGFAGQLLYKKWQGWFSGIGVDPGYGGMGIGTTIFFMLMRSFKDVGAKFSTLFTGETNLLRKYMIGQAFKWLKLGQL